MESDEDLLGWGHFDLGTRWVARRRPGLARLQKRDVQIIHFWQSARLQNGLVPPVPPVPPAPPPPDRPDLTSSQPVAGGGLSPAPPKSAPRLSARPSRGKVAFDSSDGSPPPLIRGILLIVILSAIKPVFINHCLGLNDGVKIRFWIIGFVSADTFSFTPLSSLPPQDSASYQLPVPPYHGPAVGEANHQGLHHEPHSGQRERAFVRVICRIHSDCQSHCVVGESQDTRVPWLGSL